MEQHRYDASNIRILGGLEAVRKRPDMYIGDRQQGGLHHLLYEVVDNCIDEALAGQCDKITVKIQIDGSCSVEDNGRGIPVEEHKQAGKSALEVVLTTLHAGGKFDKESYQVSGGLHGVGLSVVNALSEWLKAEVYRGGCEYFIECKRGKAVAPVKQVGQSGKRGTMITFKPDEEMFGEAEFQYDTLMKRLREMAYLSAGIQIIFIDERVGKKEVFRFDDGIKDYVKHLNEGKNALHPKVIYFAKDAPAERLSCEIAMQYHTGYTESVLAFANNICNIDGGTHLSGFKTALTRTMNAYARNEKMLKNSRGMSGEDLREGLTAVISVKVAEPHFEAQTKVRLSNPEVGSFVETTVNEQLGHFLEENPAETKRILNKALQAAAAREAARKARELTRRKGALSSGNLPGKLWDCSRKNAENTELFIVEGPSAGGSAKAGRDRETQAILPLRGKIINVEKARIEKVLGFEEIRVIISALGTGIGVDDFDLNKCRYEKIVLMTDADIDGAHIRTLLLTFLFRQMPQLLMNEMVYVAQPPLYGITFKNKRKPEYILSEAEMRKRMIARGLEGTKLVINGDGSKEVSGEELSELVKMFGEVERAIAVLNRRGIIFREFVENYYNGERAPGYLIRVGGRKEFCYNREEFEEQLTKLRGRVKLEDEDSEDQEAALGEELHEVDKLNEVSDRLREKLGLDLRDFLPVPTKSESDGESQARFRLINEDESYEMGSLAEICSTIRQIGGRGIEIKRFKGLGEMNAEQLWETTMDPARRTLLKVKVEDAGEADRLFSILMGDDVEQRRMFIQEHALEVQNLDV